MFYLKNLSYHKVLHIFNLTGGFYMTEKRETKQAIQVKIDFKKVNRFNLILT